MFALLKRPVTWVVVVVLGAALATIGSSIGSDIWTRIGGGEDQESVTREPPLLRTEERIFRPLDVTNLSLGIERVERGRCYEQSAAYASNPDAHLCVSDGIKIHDPCFAFPRDVSGVNLLCLVTPWVGESTPTGLVIRFNGRYDEGDIRPRPVQGLPWAIELANGQRCIRWPASTIRVAGRLATHFCYQSLGSKLPNGDPEGWIFGPLDDSEQPWLATFIARGTTESATVEVRAIWN